MVEDLSLNDGHYFLDKSQVELERLDLAELIIKDYMKQLVWAPIDLFQPSLRILDSAAANGKWIQDLRETLPRNVRESSTFVTADITDVFFPSQQPEGITYLVQSMLDEWPSDLIGTFDLVHQRTALPAANKREVKQTIRRLLGLVKPGGWIQIVEADHSIAKGPAMADFFRLLVDIFAVMDTGTDYGPQLKTWLTDVGVEEVQEKIFDIPLGADCERNEMQKKTTKMFDYGVRGLIDVGRTIPTSFTKADLDMLEERVHKENSSTGGVFRLHCVWGRKPLLI